MQNFRFIDATTELSFALHIIYDAKLVLLSLIVISFSCYTAFYISEQLHQMKILSAMKNWPVVAAMIQGGGLWVMHFIAMMDTEFSEVISYDIFLMLMALFPAIITSFIFLSVNKTQPAKNWRLLYKASFMAIGMIAMHYISIAAMISKVTVLYNTSILISSFFFAFICSILTLKLKIWAHCHPNITFHFNYRLLISAIAMAATFFSMHFFGMLSSSFFKDSTRYINALNDVVSIGNESLIWIIGVFITTVVFVLLRVSEASYRNSILALEYSKKLAVKVNNELRKTQMQLVQTAKLATVGDICAGLAHELNQPLGIISLNVQYIENKLVLKVAAIQQAIAVQIHPGYLKPKKKHVNPILQHNKP